MRAGAQRLDRHRRSSTAPSFADSITEQRGCKRHKAFVKATDRGPLSAKGPPAARSARHVRGENRSKQSGGPISITLPWRPTLRSSICHAFGHALGKNVGETASDNTPTFTEFRGPKGPCILPISLAPTNQAPPLSTNSPSTGPRPVLPAGAAKAASARIAPTGGSISEVSASTAGAEAAPARTAGSTKALSASTAGAVDVADAPGTGPSLAETKASSRMPLSCRMRDDSGFPRALGSPSGTMSAGSARLIHSSLGLVQVDQHPGRRGQRPKPFGPRRLRGWWLRRRLRHQCPAKHHFCPSKLAPPRKGTTTDGRTSDQQSSLSVPNKSAPNLVSSGRSKNHAQSLGYEIGLGRVGGHRGSRRRLVLSDSKASGRRPRKFETSDLGVGAIGCGPRSLAHVLASSSLGLLGQDLRIAPNCRRHAADCFRWRGCRRAHPFPLAR